MSGGVPRSQARAQAVRMLTELDTAWPDSADLLAGGALHALQSWEQVAVRIVAESQTDAGCSVAGAYLDRAQPPVIAVATAASSARQDFTALHELGHHLQRTCDALIEQLLAQPDDGFALEDAACDAFAAAVLLPEPLVNRHIPSRGPTADDVVALWHDAHASRAAVCVRASERLPAPGHVLLLDTDATLVFGASHRLPPLRRGSDQSSVGLITDAINRASGRVTGRTRLTYRDDIQGEELYAQIVPIDGYLLAVLVLDSAPWRTFSPPTAAPGPRAAWRICEWPDCDHHFQAFSRPCERCGAPVCPACDRCACVPKVAERTCPRCNLVQPASMFVNAEGPCRDCS
ncbi:MAG TPA: ImmA/IrrE family metallo-endopeptidase [Actinocrinis sp.]|uniref:ImmA/IrrE family metallo-endopeptidase n=1 Tax=Actinocrinis sp. TaxID=1920516 RepID=UPI002DDCC18A|nr:ImmA/IrrE family metallo-endopeptidase [Actinocrinis sp.]HEV2345817.1 ImmA/IrrE family metallo-endopeptidase [Actinocrinis sp.]